MVTVEDPVEYPIRGAVQTSVSTAAQGEDRSKAFARALMHFCRINPSSGMVSEIRDAEAARQVMRFVDTGHQVWTTIHADSANGIVFRLLDFGVPPAQLCKPGNFALLMKQVLVPVLCETCRLPAGGRLARWLERELETSEGLYVRNPQGCHECRREAAIGDLAWRGYSRSSVVAEMIVPDEGYLEFVRQRDPIGALRYWRETLGGVPVEERISALISDGLVDPGDAAAKGVMPVKRRASRPELSVIRSGAGPQ